jgi:MFS family permease
MMASLGQLIGPLLAVLLIDRAAIAGPEPNAQAPVFLAATLGAVLALLLSLALPRGHLRKPAAPAEGETRALGFVAAVVSVMGRPGMPFAMMVSMVVISSVDILIMYLPLYGEARNLSVALVGSLLAIRAASSFVSRLFMGRMIDRLGRSGVLALSMAIAGAGLVTIALTDSPVILGTAMVFVGLGLGLGQPMTMAWVASRAPEGERATALAVRLTGNRVALVTTPIVVGAAAGIAGVSVAFWILAAMLGGSALAAIVRPLQSSGGGVQRVSVEVDDQDRA